MSALEKQHHMKAVTLVKIFDRPLGRLAVTPCRTMPYRHSIAERALHPCPYLHVALRKYREMPLLYWGYHTSSSQSSVRGIAPNLFFMRRPKPHIALCGGIAEIISRYRAMPGYLAWALVPCQICRVAEGCLWQTPSRGPWRHICVFKLKLWGVLLEREFWLSFAFVPVWEAQGELLMHIMWHNGEVAMELPLLPFINHSCGMAHIVDEKISTTSRQRL